MQAAVQLFLTLTGVTFLFACSQANRTLHATAQHALRLCRGRAALLPMMFFFLAALLASVGPGAILSTALVAPLTRNIAIRLGYLMRYDAVPSPGFRKLDTTFTTGIQVTL